MLQSWLDTPCPTTADDGDDRRDDRHGESRRRARPPAPARSRHRCRPRVVLVPLLVLGGGVGWFWWQLGGARRPGDRSCRCELERGWGVPRDRRRARERRTSIGSALAFNVYARLNGDSSFQAGTYDLRETSA